MDKVDEVILQKRSSKPRPNSAYQSEFELREASKGSVRLKKLNPQNIPSGFFHYDALQESIKSQEEQKASKKVKKRQRSVSLPANLTNFQYEAINPIVLPRHEILSRDKSSEDNPKFEARFKRSRTIQSSLSSVSSRDIQGTVLQRKKLIHKASIDSNSSYEYESYFICVKLPTGSTYTIQVNSSTTMDELLSAIIKKKRFSLKESKELPGDKFSLEIQVDGKSPISVDLDRTIGFYRNPKVVSLTDKEKKYSAMYMTENGKDVMVLKPVNGKFEVMACLKEKSVERLLDEEKTDRSFREIFLLTYRSFMKPEEFLEMLIKRYHSVPPEDASDEDLAFYEKTLKLVRLNVFYVLKEWCKWYYHDFALNEDLRNELQDFVNEIIPELSEQDEIVRVQCAELNKLLQHREDLHKSIQVTMDILKTSKGVESLLKTVKPREIAEQLCLWNQSLFKNISPVEFLNQVWLNPENKHQHSPNLTFFIERFERESYWVASEICSIHDLSKRASVLKRFINITQECLNLNNLFSLFSFLAGLNLTPVQRLRKTWAHLPVSVRKQHERLEKMSDPSRNMLAYRTFMSNCTPPIIPFLPIFLKDMIFFNDGNPSKIEGDLINFEKLRMMTDQIKALTLMAHVSYKFQENPSIQNYIRNPKVETITALMEISNKLEPRK